MDVGHWQRKWKTANERRRLKLFEKRILERISRQWRSESIEAESKIDYQDAYYSEKRRDNGPVDGAPESGMRPQLGLAVRLLFRPTINRRDHQEDRIQVNAKIFGQLA